MLVVETIAKIRRAYFVQNRPIKTICRELRVSRKVVRKVIRSRATEFRYERGRQPRPRIDPWRDQLDGLLLENEGKPVRERLTRIRIFEELRALGYEGSYDAIRRYAKRWRTERGAATAEAYVPLSFAPGEAYQFDWSHEIVLINGTTVTVKLAHVRLCHSRMLFVRAYPRETQEMVFDAHNRAFAFFKGTCSRGIYDNMKTAVEAVFIGKDRQFNRRFSRMCSHYLVEPTACTPASGWEKGQVENQVGVVRERFFTPRLRVASYEELNAWLLDRCVAYAKAHRHPELADRTIWQTFEAERPQLVPIAGPFDGFHATQAAVSKTCLVRFDNNKYSVASCALGRPVEIQAYTNHKAIGIGLDLDRPTYSPRSDRVFVVVEPHQTGLRNRGLRRVEPVEWAGDRHQLRAFRLEGLPDRAVGQLGMPVRLGVSHAAVEQPSIQLLVARHPQPRREEALAHHPDLVLDLTLLPARSRRAGGRLNQVMPAHPQKPAVELAVLADGHGLDRRFHVV